MQLGPHSLNVYAELGTNYIYYNKILDTEYITQMHLNT